MLHHRSFAFTSVNYCYCLPFVNRHNELAKLYREAVKKKHEYFTVRLCKIDAKNIIVFDGTIHSLKCNLV